MMKVKSDREIVQSAAKALLDRQYSFGSKIEHHSMFKAFDMEVPSAGWSYGKGQRHQIRYMSLVEKLRDYLLENNKMDLVSVRGYGYMITQPRDQSADAARDSDAEIAKSLKKRKRRQKNVETGMLTAAEQAKRLDDIARTDSLRLMFKHSRKRRRKYDENNPDPFSEREK